MNSIIANIKSLLTGQPVEETPEDEPKRNPYPNGPVTYKTMTNGQIRRMQTRNRKKGQERAFKAQRRNYLQREAERAALRGVLQVLGHIPYIDHQKPDAYRVERAQKWATDKYGGIKNAIKRYEHLSGEKVGA